MEVRPEIFQNTFRLAQDNVCTPMVISEVFAEKRSFYLNDLTLFIAHFNIIPNFIQEINIDCQNANIWFAENYKAEIQNLYYNKRNFNRQESAELDDIFYLLYEDLIVYFNTGESSVRFLFRKTANTTVESVIEAIKKFKKKKQRHQPEIYLIVHRGYGMDIKCLQITKPILNIQNNYNDDFKEIHQTILKRLSAEKGKGLVLLHGKPGTGKTSYIRYLITSLKKNVIFLPPNMAAAITNPELIPLLIDNPDSVFVIEDAENIVVARETDEQSPVSALLNISDGLLSDCLNIQIICSFNTDISKVDNALLRKGRLIAKYEFKALDTEKAQALSHQLGFKTHINHPMTLTEIYNQEEKDFTAATKRQSIGFARTGNG